MPGDFGPGAGMDPFAKPLARRGSVVSSHGDSSCSPKLRVRRNFSISVVIDENNRRPSVAEFDGDGQRSDRAFSNFPPSEIASPKTPGRRGSFFEHAFMARGRAESPGSPKTPVSPKSFGSSKGTRSPKSPKSVWGEAASTTSGAVATAPMDRMSSERSSMGRQVSGALAAAPFGGSMSSARHEAHHRAGDPSPDGSGTGSKALVSREATAACSTSAGDASQAVHEAATSSTAADRALQRRVSGFQELDESAQVEISWAERKGRAVADALVTIYGVNQSDEEPICRNLISICDSYFERRTTMATLEACARRSDGRGPPPLENILVPLAQDAEEDEEHGASQDQRVGDGRLLNVRSKVLQAYSQPTGESLVLQLRILRRWLPKIISLDEDFDIRFDLFHDVSHLQEIDAFLRGPDRLSSTAAKLVHGLGHRLHGWRRLRVAEGAADRSASPSGSPGRGRSSVADRHDGSPRRRASTSSPGGRPRRASPRS